MRIGFLRVFQKTNSFARTTTEIDDFRDGEWLEGSALLEHWAGTNTVPGGVLQSADSTHAQIIPLFSASAPAGGPVSEECLQHLSHQIFQAIDSLSEPLDGVILEFSGNMVTESAASGDEFLVSQVADLVSGAPVVLAVPMQANLTENLVQRCAGIVTPQHVPAIDAQDQGRRAVDTFLDLSAGGRSTTAVFKRLPLLIPVAAQRTSRQPIYDITGEISNAMESDDLLAVSFLCGYPFADVSHAGASIVATSRDSADHARHVVDELSTAIWKRRQEFFVEGSNVEEAVHHAMASREGPVLIADLGDNPDDGAPGDGTTTLWALLDLGVRNATIGALADEQAVDACIRAGVDSRVEIPVGGRRDTRHGYPIDVSGIVTSIHDGAFRLNGPLDTGVQVDAGRIVVLNLDARHEGHVELILTERPIQITDTSFFHHIGIDQAARQIISIKSVNDYRPAFESIASEIFEVITPGITTPDPAFFAYQHVERPIYPLDNVEE